jgi:hypothetical protein
MAINLYSKDSVDSLLSAKLSDAPVDGSTYGRKDGAWEVVSGSGGLTINDLSNGATSTLNSTAPTTGQALTFDGTDLVWATIGGGSYLPLAGGSMDSTAVINLSDGTSDSQAGGWGYGVELISDTTQNATIQYNAVSVQNGSGTMTMGPTGLTFPDSTTQTTAAVSFNGGTVGSAISVTGSSGTVSIGDSIGLNLSGSTSGAGITFADSTVQTTAAVGADPKKAIANIAAACLVFDNYTPQIIFMGPFGYSVSAGKYSSGNQYQLGIGTIGSTPTAFTLSSSNDSSGHMIAVSGAWGSYFGQSIAYSDDYGTTWTYSDLII